MSWFSVLPGEPSPHRIAVRSGEMESGAELSAVGTLLRESGIIRQSAREPTALGGFGEGERLRERERVGERERSGPNPRGPVEKTTTVRVGARVRTRRCLCARL